MQQNTEIDSTKIMYQKYSMINNTDDIQNFFGEKFGWRKTIPWKALKLIL